MNDKNFKPEFQTYDTFGTVIITNRVIFLIKLKLEIGETLKFKYVRSRKEYQILSKLLSTTVFSIKPGPIDKPAISSESKSERRLRPTSSLLLETQLMKRRDTSKYDSNEPKSANTIEDDDDKSSEDENVETKPKAHPIDHLFKFVSKEKNGRNVNHYYKCKVCEEDGKPEKVSFIINI